MSIEDELIKSVVVQYPMVALIIILIWQKLGRLEEELKKLTEAILKHV